MSEHEFEATVERLMKQDLAAGTDAFRDDLLARCLSVLGADEALAQDAVGTDSEDERPHVILDSSLELLAAAGPPYVDFPADHTAIGEGGLGLGSS